MLEHLGQRRLASRRGRVAHLRRAKSLLFELVEEAGGRRRVPRRPGSVDRPIPGRRRLEGGQTHHSASIRPRRARRAGPDAHYTSDHQRARVARQHPSVSILISPRPRNQRRHLWGATEPATQARHGVQIVLRYRRHRRDPCRQSSSGTRAHKLQQDARALAAYGQNSCVGKVLEIRQDCRAGYTSSSSVSPLVSEGVAAAWSPTRRSG